MYSENTHLKLRAPKKNLKDPKKKKKNPVNDAEKMRPWRRYCCTDSIINLYKQNYKNTENNIQKTPIIQTK